MAGFDNDVVYGSNIDLTGAGGGIGGNATLLTDGQMLIASTTLNAGGTHVNVGKLTSPDGSVTVGYSSPNITLSTSAKDLHTARFIVSSSGTSGTGANYSSIAAAIAAAQGTGVNSTVFIQPGTYTENLTLVPGVNLTAFGSDSSQNGTGVVIINGTCTLTTAGTVTISGIQLQTNSAALLAITGSAASVVNLENCYLNCTNNTGITFSASNTSAALNIRSCSGNLGTTGIAIFAHSSTGTTQIYDSDFKNSGASTTANTVSAGTVFIHRSMFFNPTTSSSTGALNIDWSRLDTGTQNVTPLTIGGSGNGSIFFSALTSGSASALSVGAAYNLAMCEIASTNTNAVTGAGTLNQYGNVYTSTSSQVNTTTTTGGAISGLTQGTAPSAGFVGEQIRGFASGVSISNNSATTITSITLTPGIWDISAVCQLSNTGASTAQVFGISTATNSITGQVDGDNKAQLNIPATAITFASGIPSWRVTISASTSYFLVGFSLFSTGTCTGGGRISGTRVG